jgi:hypothetical protein
MSSGLTLLWIEALEADLQTLREAASRVGGTVEQTPRAALPQRISTAIQLGAVVVLAGSDVEASIALRSGADEVVRSGELSGATIGRAIETAQLRYSSRRQPMTNDGDIGSRLLASAFTAELDVPLASAALDCDVLWDALGRVLYATERLADWGSLNAPIDQLRELAALRASAPSSVELRARVEKLRSSVARAGAVVRTFNALTIDTDGGQTRVDELARAVVEMLRAHLQVVGDLTFDAERCYTQVPRATVVHVVTGLLANAIGTLHGTGARGHLDLRVFEAEGAVVIEVRDDASPAGRVPLSAVNPALADVQARARGAGGDLFLDEDATGKTARVVLPASDGLGVAEAPQDRDDRLYS